MKKFLLSAAALMAAMTMNAQEVCVFNADNAMGLDSENGTALTAGTVLGETASIVATVGGDDTYKPQSATFTVNGTDITGGLQGGTNPKDADGLVPATSLVQPAGGAFLVFEAKADGFLYVMHKASSNKAYTVFEEGVAISYTFTAIGDAATDLGAVYSFTLPYEVENEQFVVKNPIEWAEQEFLKITAPDKYAARWSKNEEGADTWDPIKINGLGVIKFPVYKDCKYIVNANGSKITAAGFAFSTADDVNITSDGIALNGEGGGSQGGETVLYENDFTGITEFTGWSQFDDSQTDGKVEVNADGVAITVGIQTGQLWQPQVMIVPDGSFNLKEDGNYKVFVTAKFPSAGTLQINMGTWSANDQAQFPVEASDDFQTIECDFEGWSVDAEGAHLLFQCGDFKGTTIVKSIKIVEIGEGGDEPEPEPEAHVYSVIGTIVGNWDTDADMVLGGGGILVYHFQDVAAGSYEFKIRQDHDWAVNWGSDFKQDGPNCKVDVAEDGSTIIVTFNPETGEITWEVIAPEAPEPAGEVLLYENDFTGITEFTGWSQFDDSQTDGKVDVDADGVAITVGIQTGQLWQPQVMIVPDGSFNLVEDGDYKVVVTAKFPTDGTLQINMGTWSANDQAQFPVTATGDFQEVVCDFPGWSVDAEGAHLLFQCGDFKGTTIVKKIQIFQLGSTGINGVKTLTPISTAIYNLKGQKVDASYKGIVIMNGKKYLQK